MNSNQAKLKFSIVTPTCNSAVHLQKTLDSVISQQGNFDLEYFLVDNESSDETPEIVNKYIQQLPELNSDRRAGSLAITFICEFDGGMYEAINKGFNLASGDIFAWINSDDIYQPGAFAKVAKVFASLPEVKWLKGITSYIDETGGELAPGKCYLYSQQLLKHGLYGQEAYFVQQDSVFWRSSLWQQVRGIDADMKLAGDYDLWIKFARLEPLYTINYPVSCFRRVSGQLSEDLTAYRKEQQRFKFNDGLRIWLLRRYFTLLEPKMPAWLNYLVVNLLDKRTPLFFIDVSADPLLIRKSYKYVV